MKEEFNLEAARLRYAGVATLLRRPLVNDPSGVDIALIGVPYDGATENRPGTRHGPREIRNMSSFTRSIHHVTRVNPYELCNIADLGDVNLTNPFDPTGNTALVGATMLYEIACILADALAREKHPQKNA